MAEYHYYGSARNKRDPQAAADMYCNAALKGDPQVSYNDNIERQIRHSQVTEVETNKLLMHYYPSP